MKVTAFVLESVEPCFDHRAREAMALNVVVEVQPAGLDARHEIRLRLLVPPDDGLDLAALAEHARAETARLLRTAAEHLEARSLDELIVESHGRRGV